MLIHTPDIFLVAQNCISNFNAINIDSHHLHVLVSLQVPQSAPNKSKASFCALNCILSHEKGDIH